MNVGAVAGRADTAPASTATGGLAARWSELRVPGWAGALLVLAMWVLVRPYRGVRHDGILYVGQTLAHMMSDTIGQDLFLVYGSQDRYSLFSNLMAPLVRLVGLGASQMIGLVAAELLFVVGFWRLTAGLGSNFVRWCAMLSLVALSHTYGGEGAFSFAEPFLTARAMAEPFVLFGLVCLLGGRPVAAVLLMLVGAAIHPLIALPGLAVGWIYLVMMRRQWLWIAALVAVPVILGAVGVAPMDGLWRRYDPAWWDIVSNANTNAFVRTAKILDWAPLVFDLGVLWFGARALATPALKRLVYAVLVCEAIFFAIWGLGADVFHDVLLTQMQFWRIFWLSHLLALMLLPLVLVDEFRRGALGRWCALAIALAALAVAGNIDTGWACIAWAAVALFAERRRLVLSRVVVMSTYAVTLLGIVSVSVVVAHLTLQAVAATPDRFNGVSVPQVILGLSVPAAVVGLLLLIGLANRGPARALCVCASIALAAWGCSTWDQRSDWQKFMENGLQARDVPFAGRIPAQASVYWDGSILELWLLLHRPDFFSQQQGSGLLFNRDTAIEYERRRELMAPMAMQQQVCETVRGLIGTQEQMASPTSCSATTINVTALCGLRGGPDYYIIRTDPSDPRPDADAHWDFSPRDPSLHRSYVLYDCAKRR